MSRLVTARPDRYADAVRARRRELRERRALLVPGHRAALRDALLVTRSDARAAAGVDLAALRREVDAHLAGPRPRALAALLPDAAADVTAAAGSGWAEAARAAVRRTAAHRGLRLPARWPEVPALPPARPAPPAPARPGPGLLDPGVWRTAALPLVVASLLVAVGATTAGPALLLPAAGSALGVLALAVRRRRERLERAQLRRWCDDLFSAAATDLDERIAHAATALAAGAGAHLDTALERHRAALDTELTLLTTERPMPDARTPWSVPDEPGSRRPGPGCGPDVRSGLDSDDDGVPDSVFAPDGDDLLLHTDLGTDGLADRTLRLRPDGTAAVEAPGCADDPSLVDLLVRFLRGR